MTSRNSISSEEKVSNQSRENSLDTRMLMLQSHLLSSCTRLANHPTPFLLNPPECATRRRDQPTSSKMENALSVSDMPISLLRHQRKSNSPSNSPLIKIVKLTRSSTSRLLVSALRKELLTSGQPPETRSAMSNWESPVSKPVWKHSMLVLPWEWVSNSWESSWLFWEFWCASLDPSSSSLLLPVSSLLVWPWLVLLFSSTCSVPLLVVESRLVSSLDALS